MAELTKEGVPFRADTEVGIMIETPSFIFMAEELAQLVDFFSVGTNDLTQYTLACDRQCNDLGKVFDPHHPAVLRAIKMAADAAQQFSKLAFVRSSPTYLEVMPLGSSKRAAVETLQAYYGLNREDTVTCGDSFVDEDMLRYAGLGIAMGNSPDQIKKAADRVTASNDEEGIYIALKG